MRKAIKRYNVESVISKKRFLQNAGILDKAALVGN